MSVPLIPRETKEAIRPPKNSVTMAGQYEKLLIKAVTFFIFNI